MSEEKRWLSKSQINTYIQCPYKWKLIYIDKKKTKGSLAMTKGIKIHKQIEEFYSNIKSIVPCGNLTEIKMKSNDSISLIPNFKKFEERRYKSQNDYEKYFKPMFQELKLKDDNLKLRGFVDAVYVNPKDDGLIVIDWKSGKFRPNNFSKYRFELAVYSELLRLDKNLTASYWGIYFVDADKLFFEKVKPISIKAMYKTVDRVREGIKNKDYKCKSSILCRWCDFSRECPEWK